MIVVVIRCDVSIWFKLIIYEQKSPLQLAFLISEKDVQEPVNSKGAKLTKDDQKYVLTCSISSHTFIHFLSALNVKYYRKVLLFTSSLYVQDMLQKTDKFINSVVFVNWYKNICHVSFSMFKLFLAGMWTCPMLMFPVKRQMFLEELWEVKLWRRTII